MDKKHLIKSVVEGSIAEEMGIEPGDYLISVNKEAIDDIFDYRFLVQSEEITVVIQKNSSYENEEWELEIEKDEDEDLGLEFESALMDNYRSCRNKCIFCFIDQMPKGMRDTLYFKDDDSRLSFLQGNYITLTNMDDYDIDKIIRYRLSPINISVHTTEPELRCQMLNNRFAGDALKRIKTLYEAGITMNGQIVLCKGVNDKEHLKTTLNDLYHFAPVMQSVSVVPVGLTKYRENLYPLVPFDKNDANEIIDIIDEVRKKSFAKYKMHFATASDELYILAQRDFPSYDEYDEFPQLENGVGMIRLMQREFDELYEHYKSLIDGKLIKVPFNKIRITLITGVLAYPFIKESYDKLFSLFDNISYNIVAIKNEFFGDTITVSGLVTGGDIINRLSGKNLGDFLLIPECMLRANEAVFLDDVTVCDLEKALQVRAYIVKSNGLNFIDFMMKEYGYE